MKVSPPQCRPKWKPQNRHWFSLFYSHLSASIKLITERRSVNISIPPANCVCTCLGRDRQAYPLIAPRCSLRRASSPSLLHYPDYISDDCIQRGVARAEWTVIFTPTQTQESICCWINDHFYSTKMSDKNKPRQEGRQICTMYKHI